MMKFFSLFFAAIALAASAKDRPITIDENGVIRPSIASNAIAQAVSATVKVDLANERAIILTNVAAMATATINEATKLLTERQDFSLVTIQAVGLKSLYSSGTDSTTYTVTDADGNSSSVSSGSDASAAEIRFVEDGIKVDRSSDEDNILVTLTWCFYSGSLTQPKILAAAALTDEFSEIEIGEIEQIAYGELEAYRATVAMPKETWGASAFFKISAQIDSPIDDGKVIDYYVDGPKYTVTLKPSEAIEIDVNAGRITAIRKVVE